MSTALMTGGALSAMATPAPVVHGVAVSGNGQLRADGLYYTFGLNARATNATTGAGATGNCTVAGGGALAAGCTSVTSVTRGTGANVNTATITGTARTLFNQRVAFRMVVVDRANPNGAGRDTVALTINGHTTHATLTRGNITITDTTPTTPPPPVNHTPVAQGDSYSTTEGTSLTVNGPGVLGNDTDLDGDQLHAQLATDPAHGTVTLHDDGSFDYSPVPFYVGLDSFTYTTTDGKGAVSAPATVDLTVTKANHAPVAHDDAYTTPQDQPLYVNGPGVLDNDTDSDADALTAHVAVQPTHGSLELDDSGRFAYTPNSGYSGTDTFTYTASDGKGGISTPATVTLTINHDDCYIVPVDGFLTVPAPGVLANDNNADGAGLTVAPDSITPPAHADYFAINSDGTLYYLPNHSYSGTDTLTYRFTDGNTLSDPVTVQITVFPELG